MVSSATCFTVVCAAVSAVGFESVNALWPTNPWRTGVRKLLKLLSRNFAPSFLFQKYCQTHVSGVVYKSQMNIPVDQGSGKLRIGQAVLAFQAA